MAGASFWRRPLLFGVCPPEGTGKRAGESKDNFAEVWTEPDPRCNLSQMLVRCLQEEQVPSVDERLVKAVRIIVEEYDGDVRAFVEAVRCQVDVTHAVEHEVKMSPGEGADGGWRHD